MLGRTAAVAWKQQNEKSSEPELDSASLVKASEDL
jgi:hypothetical protein